MKKKHKVRRSSVSGEFITKEEAEANPRESTSETVITGDEGSDNKEDGTGETADSVAE
jgi:hypothetical protein